MTSPATCGLWSLAAREGSRTPSGACSPLRRRSAAASCACCALTTAANSRQLNSRRTARMRVFSAATPHRTIPQQNGVIERRNQTVVGMARALLKQRGMSTVFWGEAVVTAIYILNRSPSRLSTAGRRMRLDMGASRQSLTYGSSAASHSTMSLAISASSMTGALQGCSSATWRARMPTALLTQRHSVCARRAM
jgi:hypothetical protein